MSKYTNPEAHGYLMEAKACKKIGRELDRLIAKYQRAVDKEQGTVHNQKLIKGFLVSGLSL